MSKTILITRKKTYLCILALQCIPWLSTEHTLNNDPWYKTISTVSKKAEHENQGVCCRWTWVAPMFRVAALVVARAVKLLSGFEHITLLAPTSGKGFVAVIWIQSLFLDFGSLNFLQILCLLNFLQILCLLCGVETQTPIFCDFFMLGFHNHIAVN